MNANILRSLKSTCCFKKKGYQFIMTKIKLIESLQVPLVETPDYLTDA